MSKIIKRHYFLKSELMNEKVKIVLISDVHISSIFKMDKIEQIIDEIRVENPNYICISGDLIDNTNILDDRVKHQSVLKFIKELAKISKVIMGIGNHDLSRLMDKKCHYKWQYDRNDKFFNAIKKIKNVHLLDNEIFNDQRINFIGFTPSYDYYRSTNNQTNILIDDLNSLPNRLTKYTYNILLCHSPVHIVNEEVIEKTKNMKKINLVLSGHMHNGMVPNFLEKIWMGNRGIITPDKKILPTKIPTRGTLKRRDVTLIISGGITKISYSAPKVLHPFNELFPMHIEIVNIDKTD